MIREHVTGVKEEKGDYQGSKLGMWIFLFTEMLLFSGLFLLYSAYRSRYSGEFHIAAGNMDKLIGTLNTVILLTSSLSMVYAIRSIRLGKKTMSLVFQLMTVALGLVFLVNKYIEWSTKFRHGIYPGSPELLAGPKGEIIYYGLYFFMTGLHGLHVLAGMVMIMITFILTKKGRIRSDRFIVMENTGLYWHFVDIVWVYLFPLFYLIS
jgi:cytochrome c oxidase subunit 3